MADFINTIDLLGDDVVVDSIINRTITEFKDNIITSIGTKNNGGFVFYGCQLLESVDCPVVTVGCSSAFEGCIALKSVNLPALSGQLHGNAFRGCSSLTDISLPNISSFIGGGQFQDCTALKTAKLPALRSATTGYEFRYCSSLRILDTLGAWNISGNTFTGCSSLIALIQRGETIPTLKSNTAFNGGPIASGAGYIYVPRALVDSYKAATNWSAYATQFRALEDYTVDGTTTGELDESKI